MAVNWWGVRRSPAPLPEWETTPRFPGRICGISPTRFWVHFWQPVGEPPQSCVEWRWFPTPDHSRLATSLRGKTMDHGSVVGRVALRATILVALLCADNVSAQVPSDTAAINMWRNEWFAYERELRAWCLKQAPAALDLCLQREMAKYGVSPAFFAMLHAGKLPATAMPSAPQSPDIPDQASESSGSEQPTQASQRLRRGQPRPDCRLVPNPATNGLNWRCP
jgi:hypothetical protein